LQASNLRTVERKLLGAMLIHANDEMEVQCNMTTLASTMGYKRTGGAITFALQMLEMKNFIESNERKYKVLL
jgi:hypothetical protein